MIRFCSMSLRSQFALTRQRSDTQLMRTYWIYFSILTGIMTSGCVTPMTMEEQSPDLDYLHQNKIVIAVIDERVRTQGEMSETYIGMAQDAFGKTTTLQIYPWFVSNEEKTHQTLSDALEQRIVFGLNDEGWDAIPAGISDRATTDARNILRLHNAENLLVVTLKKWNVSLNSNWITPLILDWDIVVTVIDKSGKKLAEFMDSGTDTVDEVAGRSIADHIRLAYRDRLIRILEAGQIRMALRAKNDEPKVADDDPAPAADVAEVAVNEAEAAAEEAEVDSKAYLVNQLKMLQLLLDDGTVTQQEFTDLVRRVVDAAGNTSSE